MRKRYLTHKKHFLFNVVAFIGFSFEFLIRSDNFLGSVLIFNGIVNLLAYQQAPRRVASVTVILNLFNALVATVVCYNYGEIDFLTLFIVWLLLSITYFFATFRQIYSIVITKQAKKKQKKKMS